MVNGTLADSPGGWHPPRWDFHILPSQASRRYFRGPNNHCWRVATFLLLAPCCSISSSAGSVGSMNKTKLHMHMPMSIAATNLFHQFFNQSTHRKRSDAGVWGVWRRWCASQCDASESLKFMTSLAKLITNVLLTNCDVTTMTYITNQTLQAM